MRATLILAMFTASLANAGWGDFEETRNLELDARGINGIEVESHAGSLEVTGVAEDSQILVTAIIHVPGNNDEKAQKLIADGLVLTLEQHGDNATLKGYFDTSGWTWGDSPSVRLEVSIPARFALKVDDGSGSLVVKDVSGDILVDDSSGSIQMSQVGGTIGISDASGSISVAGVGGDISIEDGSGSINVREVDGSVIIDDGSGSITVSDVGKDLTIVESGSGSVNYSNVQGVVQNDT